jgi:hypothetical protein
MPTRALPCGCNEQLGCDADFPALRGTLASRTSAFALCTSFQRTIGLATNCLPTWSVIARLTAIAFAAREPAERTPCSWRIGGAWRRAGRDSLSLARGYHERGAVRSCVSDTSSLRANRLVATSAAKRSRDGAASGPRSSQQTTLVTEARGPVQRCALRADKLVIHLCVADWCLGSGISGVVSVRPRLRRSSTVRHRRGARA